MAIVDSTKEPKQASPTNHASVELVTPVLTAHAFEPRASWKYLHKQYRSRVQERVWTHRTPALETGFRTKKAQINDINTDLLAPVNTPTVADDL